MNRCGKISRPRAGVVAALSWLAMATLSDGAEGVGAASEQAGRILQAAGVKGGLIVHLGCGDGKLTAALRTKGSYLVHGLDASAVNVAKAREHIRSRGLYGKVSVETFDGKRLPYVDNLVNLIVAEDAPGVAREEMLRVLAPRGVACIRSSGEWTRLVKPWPKDMDEWTHWLHGAGNNAVSRDRRVGISRNLQWIMPPRWSRHHNLLPSVSAMVSAKGRIFYIIDEAPTSVKGLGDRWSLNARDAFNGVLLWKRPITNWGWKRWSRIEFAGHMRFKGPSQLFRRLVAVGEVVYVTMGFDEPVAALDAATGRTMREYKGTENTSEILHHNGLLVLARNATGGEPGKDILAVNADTGAILWERKGYKGITAHGDELAKYTDAYVTVGGGKVFFLDRDDIVALDLRSGSDAWRKARPKVKKNVFGHYKYYHANLCTLVCKDNALFLGQMDPFPDNLNRRQEKDMTILALDAASGKTLWEYRGVTFAHFTPPDLFVANGLVWTFKKREVCLLGLDVRTGKVRKEYPARTILVGHHARCYRNKATERFYLAGEEGVEYIDLASGQIDIHHWARGACRYGIMPANGLIYLPTHSCGCHHNVKLNGFLALTSDAFPTTHTQAAKRLTRGPAYAEATASFDKAGHAEANPGDWPVYKHDNTRSNHAATDVPVELSNRWTKSIGGRLTAPVVVGNSLLVASQDCHQAYCLNADTGTMRWQFTADGPIDTPPSWCKGRIVFGSRGGSVYALRADDGQLIWRFRAAPEHLRLTAFGRLESPWPLHGSLLVMNDKVYCVAGRSMHLNSGLYVYALDVNTGRCLRQAHLEADTEPKGELKGAVLPDILVSDGSQIHMRSMSFSPEDLGRSASKRTARFLRANDGGLLDGTWFNSTFWLYGGARAQMLAFDAQGVYGVRAYRKFVTKSYPHDIFTAGKDSYRLFAAGTRSALRGSARGMRRRRAAAGKWTTTIPLRAEAIVLTNQRIYLAGPPDIVDEKDPLAALEGRKGGLLAVFSKADGEKQAQYKLDSPPVFDGLIAAAGRLFMCTADGHVVCLGRGRR